MKAVFFNMLTDTDYTGRTDMNKKCKYEKIVFWWWLCNVCVYLCVCVCVCLPSNYVTISISENESFSSLLLFHSIAMWDLHLHLFLYLLLWKSRAGESPHIITASFRAIRARKCKALLPPCVQAPFRGCNPHTCDWKARSIPKPSREEIL